VAFAQKILSSLKLIFQLIVKGFRKPGLPRGLFLVLPSQLRRIAMNRGKRFFRKSLLWILLAAPLGYFLFFAPGVVAQDIFIIEDWVSRFSAGESTREFNPSLAMGRDCVFIGAPSINYSSDDPFAFDPVIYTIKYDSNDGNQIGTARRYNHDDVPFGEDMPTAITADIRGNVYVTGYSEGFLSNRDFLTMKLRFFPHPRPPFVAERMPLRAQRATEWIARFDRGETGDDVAYAVTVDRSGSVYVAGSSDNAHEDSDYLTIKYSPIGRELWRATYDGDENDVAHALAVDGRGNLYVTGISVNASGTLDIVTIKYASNDGRELWRQSHHTGVPVGGWVEPYKVLLTLDGEGNAIIGGQFAVFGTIDFNLIKYDPAGMKKWAVSYGGSGDGVDVPTALGVDAQGNIYISGFSHSAFHTFPGYLTLKYDKDPLQNPLPGFGLPLWDETFYDTLSASQPTALAVTDEGSVFVTGMSGGDFLTIAYSQNGGERWRKRYQEAGADCVPSALGLGDPGTLFVTGTSQSAITYDLVTIKYQEIHLMSR
jgi:hypothetical protein